jgi:hypothetical protein
MVFSHFEASFKTFYVKYCSINIVVIRFCLLHHIQQIALFKKVNGFMKC